eukprot:820469-Lingulodinium_polyedra.AAC.1
MWGDKVYYSDYADDLLEVEARVGWAAEKDDVRAGKHDFYWKHTCAKCVAKRDGITQKEALRNFNKSDSRAKRQLKRAEAY